MLTTLNHTISQQVADIIDIYTELHGTRVSLFGPDRQMLYPAAEGRPNCTYCRMLRETLGQDSRCRALDGSMMDAALEQRTMISYTCHGGMREAVAPLFSAGQLAGFVMIGQFRSRTAPSISPYKAQWEESQGNNALQEAFLESTVLPEEKIENLLAMFSQLLELIIRGQLIHRKDYDLIEPVIEQIRQNPAQPLRLDEAARITGRSASTVTRLFKKMTGRSFKQYQVDMRLQRAGELLVARPNCPVAEIAREIGIEDPFYFSRLFHKHNGLSPSDYRKTHQRK
ncbi:PocR ligand-binding domain-containing protein [Tichowtungia aerotolerans]|uniref:Helix-turn-helix domain-containing protein n=1 Tax=Tichowtungia aerotolerans TaxID=2697043 RepID=A0A6P1M2T2_9BACT|nr:PocR ligand-binding domain-containing protein [Tichowtungia aerotolerans]QHI68910.1 helix-turn-helix domain-containing protein [Tichowtungia aerotolerans]